MTLQAGGLFCPGSVLFCLVWFRWWQLWLLSWSSWPLPNADIIMVMMMTVMMGVQLGDASSHA